MIAYIHIKLQFNYRNSPKFYSVSLTIVGQIASLNSAYIIIMHGILWSEACVHAEEEASI